MSEVRSFPRIMLTKAEAAASLGMSVRHFERHVQPHLKPVRTGQLTHYRVTDLDRWTEREAG